MWVARRRGVDLRAAGSGNVGATNVARTLGAGAGAITLAIDFAKGAIPVAAVEAAGATPTGAALVGLAAVVGHVFPVFSGGRGGKGVATAAGVFAVATPGALGLALIFFLYVASLSRRVAAASLFAAAVVPLVLLARGEPSGVVLPVAGVTMLVFLRHRDNVRRLLAGTVPVFRFGGDRT